MIDRMTSNEDREFLATIERKWDRESRYRLPDGRLDWSAIQGYVMMLAMLIVAVYIVVVAIAEA
jgi:hypothetical protein